MPMKIVRFRFAEIDLHLLSHGRIFNRFVLAHWFTFGYAMLLPQAPDKVAYGALADVDIQASFLQPVMNLSSRQIGIFSQPLKNLGLNRLELFTPRLHRLDERLHLFRRHVQVFVYGVSRDVQFPGNLGNIEPQLFQLVDFDIHSPPFSRFHFPHPC